VGAGVGIVGGPDSVAVENWPATAGAAGQVLTSTGGGTMTWATPSGGGNVFTSGAPTGSQWAQWTDATHITGVVTASMPFVQKAGDGTDNRVARWDGTTAVQNSGVTLDDANNISGLGSITGADNLIITKPSGTLSVNLTASISGSLMTLTGSGGAGLYFKDNNATTDNKFWQINSQSGATQFRTLTDVGGIKATLLSFDHATSTITTLANINAIARLTGGITGINPSAQLTFGSYLDNDTTASYTISHIDLYGGSLGFGISGAALNHFSSGVHNFFTDNIKTKPAATIKGAGIDVNGTTSGTISLNPQAAAGTYNWNWPTTSGAAGQVLTSGGGGSGPMTWSSRRELLSADRTYYVRSDGNDSNSGLANNSGNAWLTLQKAWNVVSSLDIPGFTVTVQIADGTYTGGVVISSWWNGAGTVVFQGNATTPANVLQSVTGNHAWRIGVAGGGVLRIKDFKITTTTSGDHFSIIAPVTLEYGNMDFGAAASGYCHFRAFHPGFKISAISSYKITGGALAHWLAYYGVIEDGVSTHVVTLTGSITFSLAFVYLDNNAKLYWSGPTFNVAGATVTGQRYLQELITEIQVGGAGINFFPGSIAGLTKPSSVYA
jgi:hypothetical protein